MAIQKSLVMNTSGERQNLQSGDCIPTSFYYKDFAGNSAPADITEDIISTCVTVAGDIKLNDYLEIYCRIRIVAASGNCTLRLRVNSSNTLSGALLIGQLNCSTGEGIMNVQISLEALNNWDWYALGWGAAGTATSSGNQSLDFTNPVYFFWTLQKVNTANTAKLCGASIRISR